MKLRSGIFRHAPLVILLLALVMPRPGVAATFNLTDATIADINAAFDAGALTSERLVELYRARMQAYEQDGPAINAVITYNDNAMINVLWIIKGLADDEGIYQVANPQLKQLAKTACRTSSYDNSKITNTLDCKFKPIEQSIRECSKLFLNQFEE